MDTIIKPKISIRDGSFAHGVGLGCGDFNWPPSFFDYDRTDAWQKVCLFTDGEIVKNTVLNSKSEINIAWILEPYSLIPRVYHFLSDRKNSDKYDHILTHCQELIETNPNKYRYYPFGGCWIQPENRIVHPKTKNISIIASGKSTTYGHKLRHEVIANFKDQIDVFGRGYNVIDLKEEALKNYRYSIVIENDSNNYWFTEKLIDCLVTGTIPIYFGSNISKIFDMEGIITFSTIKELAEILPKLTEEIYLKKLPMVQKNLIKALEYACPEDWIFSNFLKGIL